MQALPERLEATEAEIQNLLKQVLPRLERFRDCVEANTPLTIRTDTGEVTLTSAQLKRGLIDRWLPAARQRFDRANDDYFELKLSVSAKVVSIMQPELATATIHVLNRRLSEARVRLDELEESIDGEFIATTQTFSPDKVAKPEIPSLHMEVEALKLRLDQLEEKQEKTDVRLSKQSKLQEAINLRVSQRFNEFQEKQASLDPKLRYLDGRTSERTREIQDLNDQMTRFTAALSLMKDQNEPEVTGAGMSSVPFRQVAAVAALAIGVGFSGVILYKSFSGDSPVFHAKNTAASNGLSLRSADGVRYLLTPEPKASQN